MPGARGGRKTDEEVIQLLLAIIDHSETNYEEVARSTGLYKSGKFV